jgi:putative ABC transport system permease protein
MNIMLVSVTERTREIGIRKAVGARNGDIQVQFLVESLTLSSIGGLLGVALGVVLSVVLATHFEWQLTIVPAALAVAFVFAVAVGLFFGVYPARKAALLDPIDALRH